MALREADVECIFVCKSFDGNQGGLVRKRGFKLFLVGGDDSVHNHVGVMKGYEDWIPASVMSDALDTKAIVERYRDVTLVVDHYSLDFDWERTLASSVSRIAVIDDFFGRRHHCDYYINPSIIDVDADSDQDWLPDNCTKLLGPKFALLDSCFSELNARNRGEQPKKIAKIFVSFGGADSDGWTTRIVELLSAEQFSHIQLEVVVGMAFGERDSLSRLATDRGDVNIHSQIDNAGEVMAQCDLAIGAGGTMTWERLCVGTPSVIIGIAKNQYEIVNSLLARSLCVGVIATETLSQHYLSHVIRYLIESQPLRQAISDRGRQFIDGRGVQRVVRLLVDAEITFRDITLEDADSIFEWRNHPSVTSVSSSGDVKFDFKSHMRWLDLLLRDKQRIAVIAELAGEPVGVCRFDLVDTTATISIYKIPGARKSAGLIDAASRWLFESRPEVTEIIAKVLGSNKPSQRSFANAQYDLVSSVFKRQNLDNC